MKCGTPKDMPPAPTSGSEVEATVGKAGSMAKAPSSKDWTARERADMYRFLSSVFIAPCNEGLLRKLRDAELLAEMSSLLGEPAVAELYRFARADETDGGAAALQQEYMDLFAVPTGRYVAPFEDVYRGSTKGGRQRRGPLLGERAIAAQRMYRTAGAEMDRECKELPSHIGVELAFMAFLCAREEEEKEEKKLGQEKYGGKRTADPNGYRELQRRFLAEHVSGWFPRLGRAIRRNSKSSFYKGLAAITEEFIARETDALLVRDHSV